MKRKWGITSFFHRFSNMHNMASYRGESVYFEVYCAVFSIIHRTIGRSDTFSNYAVLHRFYSVFRALYYRHFRDFFIFCGVHWKTKKSQKPLQNQWLFDDVRCFVGRPRAHIADRNRSKSIGFISVFTFFSSNFEIFCRRN